MGLIPRKGSIQSATQSDDAQEKLVLIVGKRFCPNTGVIRLTSRELPTSEQVACV